MKAVKFLALLALLFLGALAGAVACTDGADGGDGGMIVLGPGSMTNMDPNPDEGWKPCAAPTLATGELKISGPYSHRNLEIYLVHGKDQAKPEREVLTLGEALEQGKVVVHETGQVGQLTVENRSRDADVYVQSGDIVQGGKQDRVLAVDMMLSPQSGRVPIASYCVEQGRWGQRQGASGQQGVGRFDLSSNCLSSLELKRAVKVAEAQSEVWDNVASQQARLSDNLSVEVCSPVSRSSLQLTLQGKAVEAATKEYTKALAKAIEGKDDVLGFAAAVNGRITSADIYGSTVLFQKLWDRLLTASAVEAVSEQKQADDRKAEPVGTGKVRAFLADLGQDKAGSKDVTDRVQVIRCEGRTSWFFETRDRASGTAWLHRNYLRK